MGRQTKFIIVQLGNDKPDFKPSSRFIAKIEEKYHITYVWKFDENGYIEFADTMIWGEPESHILALLETAKHYKIKISGNLVYDDDQSAAHYLGVVYIADDYKAKFFTYDFDVKLDKVNDVPDAKVKFLSV